MEGAGHVFRSEYGKVLGALLRRLGRARFELAEDAVQEAMLAAVRTWPLRGMPENPGAWLMAAARNAAVDALRHQKPEEALPEDPVAPAPAADDGLPADELRLMFLCCHPLLAREDQVALTLQAAGGFGAAEIARAFFMEEAAVAQRLVRAKRKLRESGAAFEMPAPADLPARLDAVLDALYLAFNEGYTVRDGDDLLRADVANEAVRLASLLADHPACDLPRPHALAALLLFQSSRLPARLSPDGVVLPLEAQDRSLWDRARIAAGLGHLARAASGTELSELHLLAGIAACHATAPSPDATDWTRIASLYAALERANPTPLVRLNRAVAVSRADGPAAGLAAVDRLDVPPDLAYLVAAARADALFRLHRLPEARVEFARAATLAPTTSERRYLVIRAT